LLIEDNPLDARMMGEMLADAGAGGYVLEHVNLISAALQCLSKRKFDVVLLDLMLPDGNGSDTVERVCSACLQVCVIVLTGLEDNAMALAAGRMPRSLPEKFNLCFRIRSKWATTSLR
jgi:two-component system, cell cycle response regulator